MAEGAFFEMVKLVGMPGAIVGLCFIWITRSLIPGLQADALRREEQLLKALKAQHRECEEAIGKISTEHKQAIQMVTDHCAKAHEDYKRGKTT